MAIIFTRQSCEAEFRVIMRGRRSSVERRLTVDTLAEPQKKIQFPIDSLGCVDTLRERYLVLVHKKGFWIQVVSLLTLSKTKALFLLLR